MWRAANELRTHVNMLAEWHKKHPQFMVPDLVAPLLSSSGASPSNNIPSISSTFPQSPGVAPPSTPDVSLSFTKFAKIYLILVKGYHSDHPPAITSTMLYAPHYDAVAFMLYMQFSIFDIMNTPTQPSPAGKQFTFVAYSPCQKQ